MHVEKKENKLLFLVSNLIHIITNDQYFFYYTAYIKEQPSRQNNGRMYHKCIARIHG